MNKVVLSLSILSLCWFISIDGWAGEFYSGQKPNPPPPQICHEKTTTTDSDGKVTVTEKERPCPTDNERGDDEDGNNKHGNNKGSH